MTSMQSKFAVPGGGSRRVSLPPNLKQLAAAHVRQAIFSGKLRPGQKVDQDAIAEFLGFSKLPVREALISLEHEGMALGIRFQGRLEHSLVRRSHFLRDPSKAGAWLEPDGPVASGTGNLLPDKPEQG